MMLRQVVAVIIGFPLWLTLWLSYNGLLVWLSVLPPYIIEPLHLATPLLALLIGAAVLALLAGCTATHIAGALSYPVGIALVTLMTAFVAAQYELLLPVWFHWLLLAAMTAATLIGSRSFWDGGLQIVWKPASAGDD